MREKRCLSKVVLSVFGLLSLIASAEPVALADADNLPEGMHVSEYCLSAECQEALEGFSRGIGDSRIVLLGEPWHGDGGSIRLRGELVEYLHQELGFDLLVFEADFFSIFQGWQKLDDRNGIRDFASENIYTFWSASRASDDLWAYITSTFDSDSRLEVAGVDVRLSGREAREGVADFLSPLMADAPGVDEEEAALVLELLSQTMANEREFRPEPDAKATFFDVMGRLEAFQAARDPDGQTSFETQAIRSIRSAGEFSWDFQGRDPAMARNLVWLLEQQYPDKRVIVASHNNHIITDKWMYFAAQDPRILESVSERSRENIGAFTYMGDEIRRFYGPEVVSFPVVPYRGHFTPNIMGALYGLDTEFGEDRELPPASDESLAGRLAATGLDRAFVGFDGVCSDEYRMPTRVLGYMSPHELELKVCQGYDGLFYLRETHGLNRLTPE